jgi:chemotaxis protein MotA
VQNKDSANKDVTGGNVTTHESPRNIGTAIGFFAGISLIVMAILSGSNPEVFLNLTGALIVIGGTVATTFISYSPKKILGMIPVIFNAFKPDIHQPADYIDQIIILANKYRTGGVKTLESQEDLLDNFYLKESVAMVVDGMSVKEITETLEIEINSLKERHQLGQKILNFMGGQAPIFGMAGTLIGLIQMLMIMSDPKNIGPSLAVALITTFYGIMLANLIIYPLVGKLSTRTENEVRLIKAIKMGILGIHKKHNPHRIQQKMNALLPHDMRRA